MKTSWLDYSKTLLEKVSFDRKLLLKELMKSLSQLSLSEKLNLIRWAKEKYDVDTIELKSMRN